ncbi:nuclear pore complex protein Nup153-like [Scylla paramamosain]|uniref:nuclear pore complex protein Nup153-like n=1 Tax=Scylla paramamosain TaxID=85552 RepID=UPI003083CA0D
MASDGPGKYRERKTRASKPYERPKGIIRRVTDSFTGLFSASWLSGWMGGEEEEESGDPQPGPSQASTHAPPGESFIFAHPVTARRSFRPFYPEEGETESNSQPTLGVNEGASTSSGVRTPPPGGITGSSRSVQLNKESSGSSLSGRRLPIISSTPAIMFTSRPKGQMEPRPLPLLTTSTPACDDGSEVSESSADTGVDASVIPRPDERDYQREILQLDEESLQTLRDSLTKPVPASPMAQPATTLPSLEETRKRPRDLEPDHSSIRAEGSVSSKSLFSETGSVSHGQPQPSALASKRPRFNVSIYGSPVMSDRSVLSDSTFKASPFYPGKTMYGGASAYRSRRLPVRSSHQPPRAQVKAKAAPQSADDGGLSQAARRILESLEQMSTPISDAKRIPTPTPGHRGSFLDSSYTAAFHRHRPPTKPSAPPSSKLLTPSKVALQENFSGSLLPSTSYLQDSSIHKKSTGTTTKKEEACQTVSELKSTEQKEEKKTKDVSSENSVVSLFSKAAAESTTKFMPSSQPPVSVTSSNPPQDVFNFGVSTSSSASATFEFTPKPTSTTLTSEISPSSKRVGKMKTKLIDSGRSSIRHEEEVMEEPSITPVPLLLPSLPKINLTVSSAGQGLQANFSSLPEGFKFSTPEVVDVHSTSETLDNAPNFTFSNPTLISEGSTPSPKTFMPTQPQLMFNSSSSSSLVPKLKTNSKKDVTPEKLKGGSILDILKPKRKLPENSSLTVSPSNGEKTVVTSKEFSLTNSESTKSVLEQPVNSVVKKTDTVQGVQGFGSMFKKSSDEWECSVCMLRNQNTSVKCVACEAQRPGQNASAPSKDPVGAAKSSASWGGSGSAWGDAFKKSASEWECDTCLVRNKDSVSKCVACETPKPGSKSEPKGVPDMTVDTKEKTNTLGFGSAFAKQKGEWECDTCLVRNKSDATKCISCETPKPGAANVSEAITGNFKFGVNTTSNDLSSVGSTFKFGLSNSQTEEKPASSGFNFGVGAKSIQEKDSQGNSGFKFGVPAEKPNAFTVHSFGSSTESDQPKDKVASSSVAFSFGVQKTDTKDKDKTEATTEPLLFGGKTSDGVESVTSTTPAFQFGSGTKTHVAFSFDAGTQDKTKEEQKTNTSIAEAKPSLSEEVKTSKTNELFDPKVGGTEGNSNKPSFTFNSITTSNKEDDSKSTATASPFGVLTNRDPPTVVASTAPPAATSAAALTAPFGATSGANTTSSGTGLVFGDKASNPNAFLSFSFSSPQPPASKEENKPALTFSFGSKIDSSENSEPAKKLSFASPSFTPTINNGVSAPSSLFTFGSKESKLGSGSGFGTPPTSTPAFGAPAPSSNATPAFQFGNSNAPARAATAPSAFGSPAPAFGSSVNSSNSGFAFGQPTEKKSSTGFDFGQAASNTGPSSFNFTASVPQSSTPGLFQFGQGQTNNSSPGGVFQFGSRNSEVQAPGTTFGNNENPFHPVPPSGRLMKKAIRRTKK